MRAVVLREFGADALEDKDIVIPELGPNQVLIQVVCASGNPVDFKLQRGDFGVGVGSVLGHDVSGVIAKIGSNVADFRTGDQVWAFVEAWGKWSSNGAYADFVAVDSRLVGHKPGNLSFDEAAAAVLTGLTTVEVVERAPLSSSSRVFIAGASGGMGTFVLQYVLNHVPPQRVFASAGSEASKQYIIALGVLPSNILEYKGKSLDDMTQWLLTAAGARFDVAYDLVGYDMKRVCFNIMAFDSHIVTIVEQPDDGWHPDAVSMWQGRTSTMFARCSNLHFVFLGCRALLGDAEDLEVYKRNLNTLRKWFEEGVVKAPAVEVLGELSAALVNQMHKRLGDGHTQGKMVIRMHTPDKQ
eukprot:TRINITY_DN13919_c0_g1_i1.p1 TRINITY_DN13919_c0_g1~~TRINITY_DN13919_c0_g1_i1.p1  ORF type:complete len:355 (-),score=80.31 TRINITY_DN13919_c0_g1_i1:55-1119(-)